MSSTKFTLRPQEGTRRMIAYLRDTLSMALILFGLPFVMWVWAVAFDLVR